MKTPPPLDPYKDGYDTSKNPYFEGDFDGWGDNNEEVKKSAFGSFSKVAGPPKAAAAKGKAMKQSSIKHEDGAISPHTT